MNQIWLAFLTGVTTGGISCMAVQGGLLASAISTNTSKNDRFLGVGVFLVFKIIAYTLLGALLGFLGAKFIISPTLQGWFQILVGVFMLGTAGRLLNLHPIFRYFVVQPPKFVYRLMKNQTKNASLFTPGILGTMTVLIPCGVTQAMMVLSVGAGSALNGALLMFAFTLGTSPVFFTLGVTALTLLKKKAFVYPASFVILILGILSINSGQILRGSYHTLQNYATAAGTIFSSSNKPQVAGAAASVNSEGKQEVTVNVASNGYSKPSATLKAGVPVKLTLISNDVQSCARSFLIPKAGVSKILPQNGSTEVEFTPKEAGLLSYTCGMGMYSGQFTVVN